MRQSICAWSTVPRSNWRFTINLARRSAASGYCRRKSTQLRRLPEYYSPDEAPLVEFAIEAYLAAQIREFSFSQRHECERLFIDVFFCTHDDEANAHHDHCATDECAPADLLVQHDHAQNTATTGVTSAINIDFVTSMFSTSQ